MKLRTALMGLPRIWIPATKGSHGNGAVRRLGPSVGSALMYVIDLPNTSDTAEANFIFNPTEYSWAGPVQITSVELVSTCTDATPTSDVELRTNFYLHTIPGAASTSAIGTEQSTTVDLGTNGQDYLRSDTISPSVEFAIDANGSELAQVGIKRLGVTDTSTSLFSIVGLFVNMVET